jgi:anti-sigma regulatory factor (Ser/Thr protein kinase)
MTPQFVAQIPRGAAAPLLARRQLAGWLGDALDQDQLASAKLLTTELITNAVLHGRGRIVLRADLNQDRLLVEVIDEGSGFEHQIRREDFSQLGGWGLSIVDQEASRWGVHEGTTHVWFELERPGPRVGDEAKPTE